MNECLDQIQLVEQIKHIIKSKHWYALTESSRFVWEKSVELMAEMINKEIGHIEPQQIEEIIENSFDSEALSKVGPRYFVDRLLEIDPELVLWSEGDPVWQKLKAEKTGLTDRSGLRAEFISKNKTNKLKDVILSFANKFGEKVRVIIIDDKEKNLIHAASLQDQVANSGIAISTFHLNLLDIKANPTACLIFLSEIQEKNIKLIVDMDGVLVNTDQVLSEIVSKKLADILKK